MKLVFFRFLMCFRAARVQLINNGSSRFIEAVSQLKNEKAIWHVIDTDPPQFNVQYLQ